MIGLVAYQRSIFHEYGRLDDFVAVYQSTTGNLYALRDTLLQAGRPIPAVFGVWLFSLVNSVGDLTLPRIISVLMVSMSGAATALLALRLIPRRWSWSAIVLAASTGIMAMSTTAIPNAVTWAILAIPLVALPTALAAGILATSERPILGHHWAASSGALIIVSVLSYQQFVMLAVMPTLLWSATRWARRQVPHWGRAVIVAIMSTTALVSSYLLVLIIGGGAKDRAFGQPLRENLVWFVRTFLPRTIDVYVPNSMRTVAVSTVLLSILLAIPLLAGIRYLALSLAVVMSWMACSLVAFPTELWASYRLLYPAQLALWAGASVAAAVSLVDSGSKHKLIPRVVAAVFVVCSLFALAVAEHRAYAYFAVPNSIDWESTRCVVANEGNATADSVLVVSDWYDTRSSVISYDEYGVIGSSVDWVLPYMVSLAQIELGISPTTIKVISIEDAKGLTEGVMRFTQDICGTLDD